MTDAELLQQLNGDMPTADVITLAEKWSKEQRTIRPFNAGLIDRLLLELDRQPCQCVGCTLRRWRDTNGDAPAAVAIVLENLTADHCGAVHLSAASGDDAKAALTIIIKALAQILADIESDPLSGSEGRDIRIAKKEELH